MQFIVPQFIDKKTKIMGPFSFGELMLLIMAGAVCIFLYFSIPFTAFVFCAVFLMGIALALIFIKVQGNSLPNVLKNLFVYLFNPKVYLWGRKATMPTVKLKEHKPIEKEEEALPTASRSRLRNLATRIETKHF